MTATPNDSISILKESTRQIPEPHASEVVFYAQYHFLEKFSEGKKWTFIAARPDAVVSPTFAQIHQNQYYKLFSGFVPSNNHINLAQRLALFLSFYSSRKGNYTSVPYPGPSAAFKANYTSVCQPPGSFPDLSIPPPALSEWGDNQHRR